MFNTLSKPLSFLVVLFHSDIKIVFSIKKDKLKSEIRARKIKISMGVIITLILVIDKSGVINDDKLFKVIGYDIHWFYIITSLIHFAML